MSRSALTYRELRGGWDAASPLLVILHGRGADEEQFVPLYASLAPAYDAYLVRAPVPVTPPTGRGSDAAQRSWYPGDRADVPEPVGFGNSLWQLEQFLRDVRERAGTARPIVLVGRDQGAVLCLTMAAIAHDWLAGVAAIDGALPFIEGWSVPASHTEALPVLLVYDSERRASDQPLADRTAEALRRRGAQIETAWVDGLSGMPATLTRVLTAWLGRLEP